MLMIASLSRSDIASRGMPVLDLYLARLAMEHQKKVGAIERVEEQCQPLNQINSTLVSNSYLLVKDFSRNIFLN